MTTRKTMWLDVILRKFQFFLFLSMMLCCFADDVDECASDEANDCHPSALCNNTDGSYTCHCLSGYHGDGRNCTDTDECASPETNECDSNAVCNNTDGNYVCSCLSGYQGDGKNCSDIDECKNDGLNECDSNALCTNTEGSYTCHCLSGYKGDGKICKALQLEIQAFQPAVVPIRAITTLTLKTKGELNVTSNSSLQCRFKDISVPARMEDGFIFCDTPPMRNIDRVSVHLNVDGSLFKTKKPLYFHDPFKVTSLTPSVVSPAQNIHLNVSGISCKDWMQYFVRFQTANGTKKTQQGICKDSVVSCFVPEFPPNTRLRVGLTLSNRLVEWADKKILIQYPIDAIRSSVNDIKTDTTKKGAFTFLVILKDCFKNSIRVIEKDSSKKRTKISVQYSLHGKPLSLRFLECSTTLKSDVGGDAYMLSCSGAENEHIYFYPSINNVPLGGQDRYEVTTTLCPGKSSCEDVYTAREPKPFPLTLILGCGGAVLLVFLVVVLLFCRHRYRKYQVEKRQTYVLATKNELELEVQLPEDDVIEDPMENDALIVAEEGETVANLCQGYVPENTELSNETTGLLSDVSCPIEGNAQTHQTDGLEEPRDLSQEIENENNDEVNEEIEMTTVKEEEGEIAMLLSRLRSSANKFTTLVADGHPENCSEDGNKNDSKKVMLILLEEMDRATEEIEQLCQQQEEETAVFQKTKETLKTLRLPFNQEGNRNINPLPSTEELKKNMTDLEKVVSKELLIPSKHNDTAV